MSFLQQLWSASQPFRIGQFIVAIVIFCYAALSPTPQLLAQHSDSYMHFLGNILLYISAWLALLNRVSVFKLALFLLPFSCMIELAQYFSPGRVVDVKDIGINIAGLTVGALLSLLFQYLVDHLLQPSENS